MATPRLKWHTLLSPDDTAGIITLLAAAAREDGGQPASEDVRLQVRAGSPIRGSVVTAHLLDATGAVSLAGFAHLGPPTPTRQAELIVHPRHRRHGVGGRLLEALLAAVAVADTPTPASTDAAASTDATSDAGRRDDGFHGGRDHPDADGRDGDGTGNELAVWAHGDGVAAAALARRYGFARRRVLLQLGRNVDDAGPPPGAALPAGVRLRPFEPGRDEQGWLELNRLAFAGHPEQGLWTEADLRARQAQPWFDPAGFLLAEVGGHLVGFHWTKVHPEAPPGAAGPARPSRGAAGPVGEVYVIGVAPGYTGSGVGRGLLAAGLQHLYELGVPSVMLYVDEDNVHAVRLYTGFGFEVVARDVCYVRRASPTDRHPGCQHPGHRVAMSWDPPLPA